MAQATAPILNLPLRRIAATHQFGSYVAAASRNTRFQAAC